MSDDWMPTIRLPLTLEQFEQLPRNSAYRYDYLHGAAILSPRPKHFHGVLDLADWQAPDPEEISEHVRIRSMLPADQTALPGIFASAFVSVQPFGGLAAERRIEAAQAALEKTWHGADGPWLERASFTAVHAENGQALGGITITLVPGGSPSEEESYRWEDVQPAVPPALRCASRLNEINPTHHLPLASRRSAGQPHLTWVFVAPLWKAGGVGSALLNQAVSALRDLGYGSLWTTFILGNDASMLWHWRNGFVLAPLPMSRRELRRQMRLKG